MQQNNKENGESEKRVVLDHNKVIYPVDTKEDIIQRVINMSEFISNSNSGLSYGKELLKQLKLEYGDIRLSKVIKLLNQIGIN